MTFRFGSEVTHSYAISDCLFILSMPVDLIAATCIMIANTRLDNNQGRDGKNLTNGAQYGYEMQKSKINNSSSHLCH